MSTVLQIPRRLGAEFTLTVEEQQQIKAVLPNAAYPYRGRNGRWATIQKPA